MPATYPAVTFEQAVDLVEQDVNIFHDILNGDNTTSVPVDVGTVPSVRKALTDMAAYKVPQPWQNGVMEIDFLQPRIYSNGFYIPVTVPITMGVAPDSNWKLFSYVGSQYTDPGWSSNWQVNLLSDEMAVARAPSTTFSQYTHSMFVCNNCYFDGSDWRQITSSGGGYLEIGENQFNGGEAEIMIFGSGAAGGVVTFTQWEATETQSPTVQDFTTSGTWTKPAGCKRILIEATGGGGAGGGSTSSGGAGGGGASGSYAKKYQNVSAISSLTINLGNGGNGSSGNGQDGNSTTIVGLGSTFEVFGGEGGFADNGFPGESATSNDVGIDISFFGSSGSYGSINTGASDSRGVGGNGGFTQIGSWGVGGLAGDGLDAPVGGGGGGGAGSPGSTAARNGGNGGRGRVIITEFY